MKLQLVAFLLSAAAQDNEAEKLFRAMEKAIDGAKALRVVFEATYDKQARNALNLKGTMLLVQGNKLRVEATSLQQGKEIKLLMISDGTKLRVEQNGGLREQDTPRNLYRNLLLAGKRANLLVGLMLGIEEAEEYHVSDFKLGKKEKVGSFETRVLQYNLAFGSRKDNPVNVTLWLDEKTNLPVKQVGASPTERLVESYSEFRLDPKLDAKQFELSK
jgi:outer membrane lipoprotein-sorting protein